MEISNLPPRGGVGPGTAAGHLSKRTLACLKHEVNDRQLLLGIACVGNWDWHTTCQDRTRNPPYSHRHTVIPNPGTTFRC